MKMFIRLAAYTIFAFFAFIACRKYTPVTGKVSVDKPPVARAGNDTILMLPNNATLLNGSNSTDPDNNIISYEWTNISGPAPCKISNAHVSITGVTGFVAGIYQFELKVTDGTGLFSRDTVQVTVNEQSNNQPLIANAGPDQTITLPLDSTYLDGSNAAPNGWSPGTGTVYSWTKISGPPVTMAVPALFVQGYMPTTMMAKNLTPGTYTFRFEIRTASGIAADTMLVNVIDNPSDLNSVTYHQLVWQKGDIYGMAETDVFINSSLRHDIFKVDLSMTAVKVYLDLNSNNSWMQVPYRTLDTYSFDGSPELLWIQRYPTDLTLVGKKSALKIKLP